MSRILALDISTSAGWALLDTENPSGAEYGLIKLPRRMRDFGDHSHPWGYIYGAVEMAELLMARVRVTQYDILVIEETNGSRSRMSQKALEYIHACFLSLFKLEFPARVNDVKYVNTSDWRKITETKMSALDKNRNAKLSRHKHKASAKGEKLDKKALGIAGRTTIKHVAIRRANEIFGLNLIAKDDDLADALLLAYAVSLGVKQCKGGDYE